MKISKSALDKILSLFVPVNRAQILDKTMKKPTVMLLFSGSCCERVEGDIPIQDEICIRYCGLGLYSKFTTDSMIIL